ncbi:hypothetical protein SAMN06297280_2785 [Arsukibacterium tuosuense]|uniref:KfrA N-terminal DNA-binding domain-containing protein n=1 Tax=Arsukibacterium tuosuense TaxID=1323745 RepID=A0A285J4A3_9GAMM|nr:hypothetical protein [Arsukibacterium tuosuense]SNY55159.1 hypothetical protein SAMN06297280_2785 [Arsukibacterium tuosuense]
MSSTIELLHQTAARLRQEGKTPSLALFKARLGGQLTAPALFSAYQQWRQQTPADVELQAPDIAPDITRPVDVASQLQRIETKLDKILALLEQQNVSG